MISRVARSALAFVLTLWLPALTPAATSRKSAKPAQPTARVRAHTMSLGNHHWRPISIGFENVIVYPGRQAPWVMLDPRAKHVTGSGGCNRITGGYQAHDSTLRFGSLATTRMTCPALQTEAKFLHALESTRRYRIKGRTLDLLDGNGELLAKLEAR